MHDINIALRHGEHVLMLQNSELIADELLEEVITLQSLARVYGVKECIERCSQGTPGYWFGGIIGVLMMGRAK